MSDKEEYLWSAERSKIWEALIRFRHMHKPTNHKKAEIIYDLLNEGCLLRPHEEEAVIAHIVDELLEADAAYGATSVGFTVQLVRRLKEIEAI